MFYAGEGINPACTNLTESTGSSTSPRSIPLWMFPTTRVAGRVCISLDPVVILQRN